MVMGLSSPSHMLRLRQRRETKKCEAMDYLLPLILPPSDPFALLDCFNKFVLGAP